MGTCIVDIDELGRYESQHCKVRNVAQWLALLKAGAGRRRRNFTRTGECFVSQQSKQTTQR